jgi:hypothetical protein
MDIIHACKRGWGLRKVGPTQLEGSFEIEKLGCSTHVMTQALVPIGDYIVWTALGRS